MRASIEALSAREAITLFKRNPVKYARGVSGLYRLSFVDCELGSAARASYFFIRNLDDFLDKDRSGIADPLTYVLDVRAQIATGVMNGRPEIVGLAKFALDFLERKARPEDNPRQNFLDVIDAMVFDYQRSQQRRPLKIQELGEYYKRTFFPVVNLMLIGLGSELRATDIPELSYSQGRVYSARDLSEDWPRGTINVPHIILAEAGLTSRSSLAEVTQSPIVAKWFGDELTQSKTDLVSLMNKLKEVPEPLTKTMCQGLISPMLTFIQRYK